MVRISSKSRPRLIAGLVAGAAIAAMLAAPSAEAGTVGGNTIGGTTFGSASGATGSGLGGKVSWALSGGTGTAGTTFAKTDAVTTNTESAYARSMSTVLTLRHAPSPIPANGIVTYLWTVTGLPGYNYKYETVPQPGTVAGATTQNVDVYDAHGKPLASFGVPWAKDANGKVLPTSYTVQNIDSAPGGRGLITQTVNLTGAVYPVQVDPNYNWGIISGTMYLNRDETSDFAGGAGTVVAGICAGAAIAFGQPAIGAGCVAEAGFGILKAYDAYHNTTDSCLDVKFIPGVPEPSWDTYTGAYCTG